MWYFDEQHIAHRCVAFTFHTMPILIEINLNVQQFLFLLHSYMCVCVCAIFENAPTKFNSIIKSHYNTFTLIYSTNI